MSAARTHGWAPLLAVVIGLALTAAPAAAARPANGAVQPARVTAALAPTTADDPWYVARALADGARYDSALAVLRVALASGGDEFGLRWLQAGITGEAGHARESVVLYERLVADHPERADELRADLAAARLALAMQENWQGRHRRAARQLEALAGEPGSDPDALKALAFARYWDGDPDGARRALDAYGRRVSDDREARELAARIAREEGASLRIEGGRADDSDELRVRSTGMELSWPLARGAAGVVGWHRDNVMDADGTADPLRLSAGLRARFDVVWSAYGTFAHTDWGDAPGVEPGGELGVVCRPVDRVRLEAVVAREPVLTRRALALGISMLGWTGAVDLSPIERLTLHAVAREGLYSDQNRAERVAAAARWRVASGPRGELALSLGTEQLNTRRDPDHGYYAPDFHREWGPGAEAEWHPREEWTLGATGQAGRQREKGSEATSFYTLGGSVERTFARSLACALEGGRSDSSLQSEIGYRRAWWQASLTWSF